MDKILIVSDGKKGHENQAISYAKLRNASYTIVYVRFKSSLHKILGYLFDWLGIYTKALFEPFDFTCEYDAVVSAGSSTYYATKLIAKACNIPSIALMQPKGFRKNFTKIYAQKHDGGLLPINFAVSQPQGVYECEGKCVALVVGGNNAVFTMQLKDIQEVVAYIFKHFQGYKKVLSTSPRTPKDIEAYLAKQPFDFKIIYSQDPRNPIGDFLACCDYLFITIDSTSMISEAVSSGKAAIEVVPLQAKKKNKYEVMVQELANDGYLHIFDGTIGKAHKKIDLRQYI
ncbi:hypothetical protein NitYY0826_C1604 [Nitratiruptor sp. YY08-26]|uniref:ELM1/GtrOC1 family putative glycosyltransferase n=1 Tax=unclassified Nitratiruptor TaxID=2624044 RepID=UPI001914E127|nr:MULTISPECIES: ELM1/GtrOC1 family putative glycosyltransferase [unclassified Nitratiruptor]BCD62721.1 hypothetical protein NitYY0813_C1602 [Nitratiruptor sp. YY08-13]BCD66657.1 hypothetical protein NitYY0826_C1604 [Nitratiruptor sp. YY08-26]